MNTLCLVGIARDETRLERLAEALRRAGFLCSTDVGAPQTVPTASLEHGLAFATPPTAVINLVCWTRASVCGEVAELQARVKWFGDDGDYISLLLDDVAAPDSIVPAPIFRVVLQDPEEDQQSLAPLVEYLRGQIEVPSMQAPTAALADLQKKSSQTLKTGKEIIAKIIGLRAWMKAGTVGVFLVTVTGLFGFFADVIGTQGVICSIPLVTETCASRGWGNVPTKAEKHEWEIANPSIDCAVFLGIYERGGHFAIEAKRRLDSARYSPGRDDDRFPIMVPYTEPPVASKIVARSEVLSRAQVLSSEMCALHAQNFVGQAEPGRFQQNGDIECETRGGGYACTIDGVAVCAFIKRNIIETCSPPGSKNPAL